MSLLNTNDELKANFSSIDKDYKIQSLQSFITDAEQDILVPRIGMAFFNLINTGYNANNLAGNQAGVLPYLQKAVTHLALMLAADSGSFRISDSGFYVVSTQNNKPVSDKKMAEFKKGRRESGYRALEQAAIFLETVITADDVAAYKNSNERQGSMAYFFSNSVDFTYYYKKVNNSAYLFAQLTDALDRAERKYIAPALGAAYYAALKPKILANSFTDAEKLTLPFIKRALAPLTIAEGIPGLSIDFEGTNLLINSQPAFGNAESVENKAAASDAQIAGLAAAALADGQYELSALVDYLNSSAQGLAGYVVPDITADVNINRCDSPTYFV